MITRFIEKSTGKWWSIDTFVGGDNGNHKVKMCAYDNEKELTGWLTMDEVRQRFDEVPWESPKVFVTPMGESKGAQGMRSVYIELFCPQCGSPLSYDGSCYPTSPLQFPHKCSNPDCKYQKTISSVHHGMFADATEAQMAKLEAGTYNEIADGSLENRNSIS